MKNGRPDPVCATSDAQPPSLFWREHGQDRLVVSELLDEDPTGWHEVLASHVLVAERRCGMVLRTLDVAV